jgi:selenocysteine lyase/cysteine desulfurase
MINELEREVYSVLETYSNVHRGSGHNSVVTTELFEKARGVFLDYLGLKKGKYIVIFCSPRRAELLKGTLKPGIFKIVSSLDFGLPLGVRAVAVKKNALPKGAPLQSGGGTTRLVSREWVIWADAPDRFEAGTPAIINVIALARAIEMTGDAGKVTTGDDVSEKFSAEQILFNDELEKYTGKEMLEKLRQTLIGRNVTVPTAHGPRPYINLDNSASTPAFMPVWNAFCRAWRQDGQLRQEIVREVGSVAAGFLGATPDSYDVFFTSNATEAINLAAESFGRETWQDMEPVVLNTLLEHNSNDLPWRLVPNTSLVRLQIDDEGFIDMNELEKILHAYNEERQHGKKRIMLVAVSGASNVLGTCNDLGAISKIVHRYGARLLVDGAQLVAHRKVMMEEWGIDYLAFSGHKVYAPFGSGALVARKGLLRFSPGEMELIRSSGGENTAGIAALGKSLVLLQRIGLDLILEEERALTAHALREMAKIPGITIYGITDPGSPAFAMRSGVIAFTMKKIFSNVIAKKLSAQGGIGIRNGCHCSHMLVKRLVKISPGLEKFQRLIATIFHRVNFPGVARVSLGLQSTEAEIDSLVRELEKMVAK